MNSHSRSIHINFEHDPSLTTSKVPLFEFTCQTLKNRFEEGLDLKHCIPMTRSLCAAPFVEAIINNLRRDSQINEAIVLERKDEPDNPPLFTLLQKRRNGMCCLGFFPLSRLVWCYVSYP